MKGSEKSRQYLLDNNMILERKKNSLRNVFFGSLNKIIGIFFPFLIRTIMVKTLGDEYLGLNSLFTSILQVLNLAELGFSSAVVFAMYKPIAENDSDTICALMVLYRKIYRVIGIVITIAGLAILPILKFFVKGGYPADINLYAIYLIYLGNTVISYEFFAYKGALLDAHQRTDIESKITIIANTGMYILQIVLLILCKNYYAYICIMPISTIIINLLRLRSVNKLYPDYKPKGKLDVKTQSEIFEKVKALFVYKIGNIVCNAMDNLVISSFLGLQVLAIYNNYYYIVSALFGFLMIYYNAIRAGLGNSLVLESKEKNYKDFCGLFFTQAWIVGWAAICMICLYQNFMILWMGRARLLPFLMVILFSVYFYAWKIHDIVHTYKDALGMWEQDKFRPLISGIVNLGGNLILVQFMGVYGIVVSTILTETIVTMFWAPPILYKNYFNRSIREYYTMLIKYTIINVCVGYVTFKICNILEENSLLTLISRGIICIVVPNLLFTIVYKKDQNFEYMARRFDVRREK